MLPRGILAKFHKCLALAASASIEAEADAAIVSARILMNKYGIDPTAIKRSVHDDSFLKENVYYRKLKKEYIKNRKMPNIVNSIVNGHVKVEVPEPQFQTKQRAIITD